MGKMMIRRCVPADYPAMNEIINESARAYKAVIPADRYHEPYMPYEEMVSEIQDGVEFWGYETEGTLTGIMGIQDRDEVWLIRHAYVLTGQRRQGIGAKLLSFLCEQKDKPILIGTWAAASWAISFYEKHGFQLLDNKPTRDLLKKYWDIPERQIETSVVLAQK